MNKIRKTMGLLLLLTGLCLGITGIGGMFGNSAKVVCAATVQRPATPVVVGTASKNVVTLKWNKVKNASGYQLYIYYPSLGKYKSLYMMNSGSKVSLKLTGSLDRTYIYRMRAYTEKNGVKTFGKLTAAFSVKTAPSRAQITYLKSKKAMTATLKWNKISSADGYQIFRAGSDGVNYTKIKTLSGKSTISYVDTTIKKAGTYYYKVRAYRKNTTTTVYGVSSVHSSVKVKKEKLIFVGDSRTVGLSEEFDNSNITWICKSSMGYSWLKSTAIPKVDGIVNADYDVCIWLGVNDVHNISNYISIINKKISEWSAKGVNTYVIAVGPVEKDPYVTNKEILSFNSKMQAGLVNATYVDLYSYLVKQGYGTVDGTHYDYSTDTKIYNYVLSKIQGA